MRKLMIGTALALGLSTPALAQNAADYSSLTSSVNWDSAITALLAVAAIVAGVLVVRKGIKFVLGMIR